LKIPLTARLKKRRLLIYLSAFIALTSAFCLVLQRSRSHQAVPIAIHYVCKIGNLNGESPFPPGARFLLTNNTSKTVIVKLSTIETRPGSVWAIHSSLDISAFTLAPHEQIYANIEPAVWPPGPWRLRGSAAEKLGGAESSWAAANVVARHWVAGRTSPGNAFSTNNTYYGEGFEITSQEVPNHK
jgi:hypothetical protein